MTVLTCPACGRRTLQRVVGALTFRVGTRRRTVPDVPRLRCSSCGEQVYDRESNRVLDAHRGRRRVHGAA
jgi:YgiT-type zinc finger domain-containing protein